jgi:hypothetical protein
MNYNDNKIAVDKWSCNYLLLIKWQLITNKVHSGKAKTASVV